MERSSVWGLVCRCTVAAKGRELRRGPAAHCQPGAIGGDFRDLFDLHPDNAFLIRLSHWFDW